jgi:hypothetical protein
MNMNKVNGSIIFTAATMFALSAWAQDESDSEAGAEAAASEVEEVVIDVNAPPSTEPGCFSIRRISNFSPLSDEALYVDGGGGNHFLLTMYRSCIGFRNANRIAIDHHMDRVCSNSLASVTYRGVGGRPDSCGIRTVEAVEDRMAARTIAEARRQQ